MVIQRENELAFKTREPLLHGPEILFFEIEFVELPVPVRRIEIEKCRRSVVFFHHFLIRQGLYLHAGQALVGFFDSFRNPFRVEVRRLGHAVMKMLVDYQPAKTVLLQIEEPCRPLDVGQGGRVRAVEDFKPAATGNGETQIADEFLVMRLAAAEKVSNIVTFIVKYFDLGGLLAEEHLCAPSEGLNVSGVLWE